MSNSLSPTSDLVIDDDDLDIDKMEVTMEDLSKAEAECSGSGGKVLARPAMLPPSNQFNNNAFKFGATRTNSSDHVPVTKSRISSADPRIKYKPSGFLSLNPGASETANTGDANSYDANFNLKRTVENAKGSSSFHKPIQAMATSTRFTFGASPSTFIQPQLSETKSHLVEPSFSLPIENFLGNTEVPGSHCEDLSTYMRMKQEHEAKIRAEQEEIEKIEKLIEQKKQRQEQQTQWSFDPEIHAKKMELAKQELELKKQSTMMLQIQQNLLMKNNANEERRRLEEKKQMLELQVQVKNLENLLTAKKAQELRGPGMSSQFFKEPVRNRLGYMPPMQAVERVNRKGNEGWREARKRRLGEEKGEHYDEVMNEVRKRKKYSNARLPDDLVLTELTEDGPVRKEKFVKGSNVVGDLFAASIAADDDEWVQFQIDDCIPVKQQLISLKKWLGENTPSTITRSSGVGWIAVKFRDKGKKVLEAKAAWDAFEGEKNMEVVNDLAEEFSVKGGKWLCHVSSDLIDQVWETLATTMMCGGLGASVYMVKVSPKQDVNPEQSKGTHVICVYNTDYKDTDQVMKVENLIRSAGVRTNLTYKPDIFSALGIYRNNEWGFRPTIYHSRILEEGKSKIEVVGTNKWYHNTSKGLMKNVGVKVKDGGKGNRNNSECRVSSDDMNENKMKNDSGRGGVESIQNEEGGRRHTKERKDSIITKNDVLEEEEDLDRYENEFELELL